MPVNIHDKFSGKDLDTVIRFLSTFQVACDQNGIHEEGEMYLSQFFFTGQANDHVLAKISGVASPVDAHNRDLFQTYPVVVHYLLKTYAFYNHIMDAYHDVIENHQRPNLTESDHADQLWTRALRCRNVLSEGRLKRYIIAGLLSARWPQLRTHYTAHLDRSIRQLVTYAKAYEKT